MKPGRISQTKPYIHNVNQKQMRNVLREPLPPPPNFPSSSNWQWNLFWGTGKRGIVWNFTVWKILIVSTADWGKGLWAPKSAREPQYSTIVRGAGSNILLLLTHTHAHMHAHSHIHMHKHTGMWYAHSHMHTHTHTHTHMWCAHSH